MKSLSLLGSTIMLRSHVNMSFNTQIIYIKTGLEMGLAQNLGVLHLSCPHFLPHIEVLPDNH